MWVLNDTLAQQLVCLIELIISHKCGGWLHLSGEWLGAHLRMDTKLTSVFERDWLHVRDLLTIRRSVVNIITGEGQCGLHMIDSLLVDFDNS